MNPSTTISSSALLGPWFKTGMEKFLQVSSASKSDISALWKGITELQSSLGSFEESENLAIIPPEVKEQVNQSNLMENKLAICFCGSNSSGKSSLINGIFGTEFSPVAEGHSTARFFMIRYRKTGFKVSIQKNYVGTNGTSEETLIKEGTNWDDDTRHDVMSILEECLLVSDAKSRADNKFMEEWTKDVVILECPEEILMQGLVLIDSPGSSITDHPAVQDNLRNFLTLVKPIIAFVYANPTISDAEMNCLELIRGCLSEVVDKNLFFISNKMDYDEALKEKRRMRDAITIGQAYELEYGHRFKLAKESKFGSSVSEEKFATISARDLFLREDKPQAAPFVTIYFQKMMEKIFTFAVSRDNDRTFSLIRLLLSYVKNMLNILKQNKMYCWVEQDVAEVRSHIPYADISPVFHTECIRIFQQDFLDIDSQLKLMKETSGIEKEKLATAEAKQNFEMNFFRNKVLNFVSGNILSYLKKHLADEITKAAERCPNPKIRDLLMQFPSHLLSSNCDLISQLLQEKLRRSFWAEIVGTIVQILTGQSWIARAAENLEAKIQDSVWFNALAGEIFGKIKDMCISRAKILVEISARVSKMNPGQREQLAHKIQGQLDKLSSTCQQVAKDLQSFAPAVPQIMSQAIAPPASNLDANQRNKLVKQLQQQLMTLRQQAESHHVQIRDQIKQVEDQLSQLIS